MSTHDDDADDEMDDILAQIAELRGRYNELHQQRLQALIEHPAPEQREEQDRHRTAVRAELAGLPPCTLTVTPRVAYHFAYLAVFQRLYTALGKYADDEYPEQFPSDEEMNQLITALRVYFAGCPELLYLLEHTPEGSAGEGADEEEE